MKLSFNELDSTDLNLVMDWDRCSYRSQTDINCWHFPFNDIKRAFLSYTAPLNHHFFQFHTYPNIDKVHKKWISELSKGEIEKVVHTFKKAGVPRELIPLEIIGTENSYDLIIPNDKIQIVQKYFSDQLCSFGDYVTLENQTIEWPKITNPILKKFDSILSNTELFRKLLYDLEQSKGNLFKYPPFSENQYQLMISSIILKKILIPASQQKRMK